MFIWKTVDCFFAVVKRCTDIQQVNTDGGVCVWWYYTLTTVQHSTLFSLAALSPLRFSSFTDFFFFYTQLTHFQLSPQPLLTFWLLIPFLFQARILTALFNIHISIFLIPLLSTLPPKSCLSFACWIIIPSSVRPCQSINLTCHLLSFSPALLKVGRLFSPLSLYLSVSLCVQIPRLFPQDGIIQFRCHLFHSWQWGLCALSSIKTVVLMANYMHPLAHLAVYSPTMQPYFDFILNFLYCPLN